MSEKPGIFGPRNVHDSRLLTIGFGLGLFAALGLLLVTARTLAQIYWPDRMADDNPADRA